MRNYTELSKLKTLKERYEYLKLDGDVGSTTFGSDRYINQIFYKSKEWQHAKRAVLIRDNGLEMGVDGYAINGKVIVHHMNAVTVEDIENRDPKIFDPEYLISVSMPMHNAIHFGDENQIPKDPVARRPGDTKLW